MFNLFGRFSIRKKKIFGNVHGNLLALESKIGFVWICHDNAQQDNNVDPKSARCSFQNYPHWGLEIFSSFATLSPWLIAGLWMLLSDFVGKIIGMKLLAAMSHIWRYCNVGTITVDFMDSLLLFALSPAWTSLLSCLELPTPTNTQHSTRRRFFE